MYSGVCICIYYALYLSVIFYKYILEFDEKTICIGVARVGSDEEQIQVGSLQQMSLIDLGGPLHSLVVVGRTHPLERDLLRQYAIDEESLLLLKDSSS